MAARTNAHARLLPPLELEVMKALWHLGEASVRDVNRELNRRRPLAYTTVMTLLDRLARKGAAARRKQGRAHIYRPVLPRDVALDLAVERLAHDFFDGSRQRLLDHLRGAEPSSSEPALPDSEESLDAALL